MSHDVPSWKHVRMRSFRESKPSVFHREPRLKVSKVHADAPLRPYTFRVWMASASLAFAAMMRPQRWSPSFLLLPEKLRGPAYRNDSA